jgi:hypothetical protein
MNCHPSDYYAVAPSCPTASKMNMLKECNEVACGEYCFANGSIPDGRSNYTIDNCMAGGDAFSVYVHLCGGMPPAPTPWHETRHEVFDCVEETNITSASFFSFNTSADIDEATVECLAACQSRDRCNY